MRVHVSTLPWDVQWMEERMLLFSSMWYKPLQRWSCICLWSHYLPPMTTLSKTSILPFSFPCHLSLFLSAPLCTQFICCHNFLISSSLPIFSFLLSPFSYSSRNIGFLACMSDIRLAARERTRTVYVRSAEISHQSISWWVVLSSSLSFSSFLSLYVPLSCLPVFICYLLPIFHFICSVNWPSWTTLHLTSLLYSTLVYSTLLLL